MQFTGSLTSIQGLHPDRWTLRLYFLQCTAIDEHIEGYFDSRHRLLLKWKDSKTVLVSLTHTHTHTLALRSLCCSPFPASFEHTVKTNSILMTTQEQVKSETSPVSTHPRSVNLTSPMLRTKSLCYRVLVPETCTDVAILHANTKTETCTPRQSLHAPIQDISTISKNKASVLHRNLDASPPRFPDKNREHGGGYGASRNWIPICSSMR